MTSQPFPSQDSGDAKRSIPKLHDEKQGVPIQLNVPVFNCIVHICRQENGQVQARVANLPDLSVIAVNERIALGEIVKAFKHRVSQLHENGATIPWIDPPSAKLEEEQTRFIPVHL